MNWQEIFWEAFKSFGPAIIAWILAVWTSNKTNKKRAEEEWKKIIKQLKITKEDNAHVQNQAYKLQFLLSEFEKRVQMFDQLISEINIVLQTTSRFMNGSKFDTNISVMSAADVALGQLHLIMFNTSTLTTLVSASGVNLDQFETLQEELKDSDIEKILYDLRGASESEKYKKEFKETFQPEQLEQFKTKLKNMDYFLMEIIRKILREMER
ncbi:hypothetical protein [Lactiplantibacillus plantarum]|uniref:hypothetical protein n=1 Tax=Lactiplantibacillus plantarum TaxID=1590 RepID=UPI003B503889